MFGDSTINNFPTYEQYINAGYTAETYTMLEDLNNINKDAEIAKKLYNKLRLRSVDEEEKQRLFSENEEEIQKIANENDIDYDTLKGYITSQPKFKSTRV